MVVFKWTPKGKLDFFKKKTRPNKDRTNLNWGEEERCAPHPSPWDIRIRDIEQARASASAGRFEQTAIGQIALGRVQLGSNPLSCPAT